MNIDAKEISVNGVIYVPKDEKSPAIKFNDMDYFIVRTRSAGVFAGYLKKEEVIHSNIMLRKARRLWYWSGAASLSQLSVDGTKKPNECKFPVEVEIIYLTEVIEAIPATQKAKDSIASVKIWEI